MQKVNVLIYTDTEHISKDDENARWKVTHLRRFLEEKKSQFVQFELRVVNRYQDNEAGKPAKPQMIDEDLLKDIDQIWFFGLWQKDAGKNYDPENSGSDQNELRKAEIDLLRKRMNEHGLGVLVSGDHSNFPPSGSPKDPVDSFLSLGKAIGNAIPRAGQLRKWDGPPTKNVETSFETLVATTATSNPAILESDDTPQKLLLFNFGPVGSLQQPHRLFLGRDEKGQEITIDILPDHEHEGEVQIPKVLNKQWPPFDEPDGEKKPSPVHVALGFDRRANKATPVLAVYDGDPHNVGPYKVGRIVADSSWHHYFDMNLEKLPAGEFSALGLLGQFYRNLALYLTPLDKRRQIGLEMLKWIVSHPGMIEERGSDALKLGRVALHYLSEVATRCEIAEMIQVALPEKMKSKDITFEFPTLASGEVNLLPTQELVIGSILDKRFSAAAARLKAELTGAQPTDSGLKSDTDALPMTDEEIVAEGVKDAFRTHNTRLSEITSLAQKLLDRLNMGGNILDEASNTKEAVMANKAACTGKEWEKSTFNPGKPNEEDDGKIDIQDAGGGNFKGTHRKTGDPLSNIKCDGSTISFSRVETKNGKETEVFYEGTITETSTKFIINGTFDKKEKQTDSAQGGEGRDKCKDDKAVLDGGDWEAEKPIL